MSFYLYIFLLHSISGGLLETQFLLRFIFHLYALHPAKHPTILFLPLCTVIEAFEYYHLYHKGPVPFKSNASGILPIPQLTLTLSISQWALTVPVIYFLLFFVLVVVRLVAETTKHASGYVTDIENVHSEIELMRENWTN